MVAVVCNLSILSVAFSVVIHCVIRPLSLLEKHKVSSHVHLIVDEQYRGHTSLVGSLRDHQHLPGHLISQYRIMCASSNIIRWNSPLTFDLYS